MTETSPFRGAGRRRDVQPLRPQGRFSTREAPAASRCGWPAGDIRPDASCGTRSARQAAGAANERATAATITSSERWAMSWNCWGVWFRGAEPLAAPEKGCEWTMTKPSTRWACGKSVTEPQYPAKSISSSAAHIRFTLFRIDGKFSIIHNTRQSQEPGIPKVHNLNRQSVGYYSTRSETAISSFLRKAFGKVADTRPLRMIASSAVRQLPTETLK